MSVRDEIVARVDKLPPAMQHQVLSFVASLTEPALLGERGADLRLFSGSLDTVSAREMIAAIDEGCEQVDAGAWNRLLLDTNIIIALLGG